MGSINNYFNVDIYARNIGKDMLHSTNSFGISYIRLYDFRNTELKTRLFVVLELWVIFGHQHSLWACFRAFHA